MVLTRKLRKISDDANTVVCATILDQLIDTVEASMEKENNPSEGAINTDNYQTCRKMCDINDNYEDNNYDEKLEDEEGSNDSALDEWSNDYSNWLVSESNNDTLITSGQSRAMASIFSIVCEELAEKTSVIFDLKRQLSQLRKEHLTLQHRYFQISRAVSDLRFELESYPPEDAPIFESSSQKQSLLNMINLSMDVRVPHKPISFSSSDATTTS